MQVAINPYWTTEGRFWPKVNKSAAGGCWEFTGLKCRDGYGKFWARKLNTTRAHRVAWALSGLELIPGTVLDHKCRNRACVNPSHLRQVTAGVNSMENSVGPVALNAAKTHCIRGHELIETNLLRGKSRQLARHCKLCKRLAGKRSAEKYSKRTLIELPEGYVRGCNVCKVSKPAADFCKNIARSDGLNGACRQCCKKRDDSRPPRKRSKK